MTISSSTWTAVGAVAAVAVPTGAVAGRWAWKYVVRFFGLFSHDKRINALAGRVAVIEQTAVTKADLNQMSDALNTRHDAHEKADTKAFERINNDIAGMLEHMAKGDDLKRVESKLDTLLLDGFNRGRRS